MKNYLLATVFILLSACEKKLDFDSDPKDTSSPNPSRFELIQLGNMRRDQYLLDKQTGQLWQPTCMVSGKDSGIDCKYSAWMKQDVEEITMSRNDIYSWSDELEKKKKTRQ